jgi:prepilin peptidase CpaA
MLGLLALSLVFAAIWDLCFRKIPNSLNITVAGISLIYYTILHGWDGLFFSLQGILLGIALLFPPYLLGSMGAGDTKLMGSIGAVLGPKSVFVAFLYSAIMGGIYAAIMLLIYRRHAIFIIRNFVYGVKSLIYSKQWLSFEPPEGLTQDAKSPKLYYGVPIAFGTLLYIVLEKTGFSFF